MEKFSNLNDYPKLNGWYSYGEENPETAWKHEKCVFEKNVIIEVQKFGYLELKKESDYDYWGVEKIDNYGYEFHYGDNKTEIFGLDLTPPPYYS